MEGNFGQPFKARQGVTWGGLLSPKIFNILVDAVVWECIYRLNGKWGDIEGVHWAVDAFVAIFYTDNTLVALRHLALLQMTLNVLIELFGNMGLLMNTKKTQTMTYVLVNSGSGFGIARMTISRRAITLLRIGSSNV